MSDGLEVASETSARQPAFFLKCAECGTERDFSLIGWTELVVHNKRKCSCCPDHTHELSLTCSECGNTLTMPVDEL